MPVQLTDDVVKNLAPPAKGYAITYDTKVKGFGCRVTAAGAKAFVLNYVTRDGRERRYTIGPAPGWKVKAARREAEDIKAGLRRGEDPLDALENERAARREEAAQPTVNTLCDRFEVDYLPTLRPASQRDYRSLLKEIRADLGALKVRDVSHDDVKGLHARLTKRAPWRANRAVAVTSKLFTYASKTPAVSRQPDDKVAPPVMRPDGVNPAKGIQLNPEAKRRRYLNKKEREAVMAALDKLEDKQGADAIRLLLLTGARKGELLAARWNDFDLEAGKWTKPGATTKQKTEHVVQLSPQVITLL